MNLKSILEEIKGPDKKIKEKAREHTSELVMPYRAMGRLHDVAEQLCAIQGNLYPEASPRGCIVFAGDHGVVEEGVSAYPQVVTGEMVKTFLRDGATINALARQMEAKVRVVDVGVAQEVEIPEDAVHELAVRKIRSGTRNMAIEPAMEKEEAESAIMVGFEEAASMFDKGLEIIALGDMGIGNTTAASAVGTVIVDKSPFDMVGPGTGIDEEGVKHKAKIIQKAIELHNPQRNDGIDVLMKVGGLEIGAIAGAILAGAYFKKPIIIDGLISTAGALIATTISPLSKDYIFAGHSSAEKGHKYMLEHLGIEPLLDLGMHLGEGSGAVLAMGIIEAAARIFKEVLTFAQAGVTEKE